MKSKRFELNGLSSVYKFTLRQQLIGRANIITCIVLILIVAAIPPFMGMLMGGVSVSAPTNDYSTFTLSSDYSVDIYHTNYSGIPLDLNEAIAGDGVTISDDDLPLVDPEQSLHGNSIYFNFYFDSAAMSYVIDYHVSPESTLSDDIIFAVTQAVYGYFNSQKMAAAAISDEQIQLLSSTYNSSIMTTDDFENRASAGREAASMLIQYAYAMILIMLGSFSLSFILSSVVEEKASKLVETLLLSVKPLALIVGKILASITFVSGLFVSMILVFAASTFVTDSVTGSSTLDIFSSYLDIGEAISHINPLMVVCVFISLVLSYLMISILSGLFGACCSNTEDIQTASLGVTFVMLAGYLVSCFTVPLNITEVSYITSLIPIISNFCAPIHYLLGDINFGVLFVSWVTQIAIIIGLSLFCSKVYAELIIHRGTRVKISQLIRMFKNKGVN